MAHVEFAIFALISVPPASHTQSHTIILQTLRFSFLAWAVARLARSVYIPQTVNIKTSEREEGEAAEKYMKRSA